MRIFGFEPDESAFSRFGELQASLSKCERASIRFLRVGMWNESSTATSPLLFTIGLTLKERASLLENDVSAIPLTTLDNVTFHQALALAPINKNTSVLIKIDVQGADYPVVQGALRLLGSEADVAVIIEVGDLFTRFGVTFIDLVDTMASLEYYGFVLGDGFIVPIPMDTLVSDPVLRHRLRAVFAGPQDMAIAGHLAIWFDVLFVRRRSRLYTALVSPNSNYKALRSDLDMRAQRCKIFSE